MQVHNQSYIKLSNVQLDNIDRIYLNYNQGDKFKGSLLVKTDSIDGSVIGELKLNATKGFENVPIKINTSAKRADLFIHFKSK